MVNFGRKSAVAEPEAPEGAPAEAASAPAAAPLAAFPRVNLIPAQIAHEASVLRAKQIVVISVVSSVAVVGGLFFMATGQVGSAQDGLDTATARSAALAAEATKYADVPKVQSDLASAKAQQTLAMGGEVRWSQVLNNLALTIPPGVSLTSFKATVTGTTGAPAATGAATSATGNVTSILGNPGIGSISYEGMALDYTRVATFLDSVTRSVGVVDPFATQVTQSADAAPTGAATGGAQTPKSVTFTATSTISPKALSHRYDGKGA